MGMRKFVVLLFLMMALAVRSDAYCFVSWSMGYGLYWTVDPMTGFLGADNSGNQALAQLIWSSDNVADPVNLGDTHYVSGNDQWLADYALVADGDLYDGWGMFAAPNYDDNTPAGHANGYVYVRVFQDATPAASEYYYVGPVDSNQNKNSTATPTPDTAQPYQVNYNTTSGDAVDGVHASTITAVPEPGTLALFGLGMLALGGRCLRRGQKK
jgi:hypothetical protein